MRADIVQPYVGHCEACRRIEKTHVSKHGKRFERSITRFLPDYSGKRMVWGISTLRSFNVCFFDIHQGADVCQTA